MFINTLYSRPRLGPMLHRVLAIGALYFILASIEGCLRVVTVSKILLHCIDEAKRTLKSF